MSSTNSINNNSTNNFINDNSTNNSINDIDLIKLDKEKEKKETNDMAADRDSGGAGGGSKLYVEGIEELVRLMVRLFDASVASGRMHP